MSVESNGLATGGVTGKGFVPGRSGNPGGRPKGLAVYVRKQTKEGKELVDFMLAILRRSGEFTGGRIPLPIRMDAATWLAERGFGKVPQALDLGGEVTQRHELTVEVRPVDYRASIQTLRPPADDRDDERSLSA